MKKLNPIVIELFISGIKDISLLLLQNLILLFRKNISLNSTH